MAHIPLILQYFIMLKCCDIRYEDWESGGGLQVIRCKRSWQGGGLYSDFLTPAMIKRWIVLTFTR